MIYYILQDESSITETSTFSEITITEDSENSLPSPRRVCHYKLVLQGFGRLHNAMCPVEDFVP